MFDFYGDEIYTRQRCDDFMRKAEKERQIHNIEKMILAKSDNVFQSYDKTANLQIRVVIEGAENTRRIFVEVR